MCVAAYLLTLLGQKANLDPLHNLHIYVTVSIDTNDKFTVCLIESIQDLNLILLIQT